MMNKIMEKYVLPTALGIAAFLYWQTLPRMKKHSYIMAAPTVASASTAAHTGVIQSPPPKMDSRRNPPSSSAQNQANSKKDPSVASRPSSHGGDMASTGDKQPQSTTKSIEQSKTPPTSDLTEDDGSREPAAIDRSEFYQAIRDKGILPTSDVRVIDERFTGTHEEWLIKDGEKEYWQTFDNIPEEALNRYRFGYIVRKSNS